MIDHLRRVHLERAWLQVQAEQPEALDISAEQRVALLQTLFELDAMLAALGTKVREAFLLSQVDGLPYKQTLVDLMTRYQYSEHLSFTVNANNVFDKVYLTGLGNFDTTYYGEPRNLMVTTRWDF
jgi:hypothetical protein